MSNLTKKVLAQALKDKINEKELAQITVSELTTMCGIKRQTFYYHFTDIYDLLQWIYLNDLEKINTIHHFSSWQMGYVYVLDYVKENKNLIVKTYHSIAKDYFHHFVMEHINQVIFKEIEEKTKDKNISLDSKKFLTNYYKNVLIGFIKDWIEDGMIEDTESLIKNVDCILEGSIDLYFKNLNK